MTGHRFAQAVFAMLAAAGLTAMSALPSAASEPQPEQSQWIELGTRSGPVPSADRSQPAHLLRWGDETLLVDVGDGASQQLAKAGVLPSDVDAIFISHLHFDHVGGLFALLGTRYQASLVEVAPLVVYGPPGTQSMVDNLLRAFSPATMLTPMPPAQYEVHELVDGSQVSIGEVSVTVAANSHYDLWQDEDTRPVSLSYRFDTPDRSIVYTGDTGPSDRLVALATGADLLVSEIMDVERAMAPIVAGTATLTAENAAYIRAHFTKQHLVAEEVGKLAAEANVEALIITHFGGASDDPAQIPELTQRIRSHYDGPVTFARDLDKF